MNEYYIGQKFEETYPSEAADWCNENNAYIKEIDPIDDVRQFEICEKEPYVPTYEDIDKARERYREEHIDTRTKARVRKMANGSWTDEDEQAYIALDTEVTAWIEENLPYPVEQ